MFCPMGTSTPLLVRTFRRTKRTVPVCPLEEAKRDALLTFEMLTTNILALAPKSCSCSIRDRCRSEAHDDRNDVNQAINQRALFRLLTENDNDDEHEHDRKERAFHRNWRSVTSC